MPSAFILSTFVDYTDFSAVSFIKRIDVFRDYRVHIDFNIDFDQFRFGLDLNRKEEAAKTA